jgi:(2Fe-2S) ferredoxin
VTVQDVPEIVDALQKGNRVERLVLDRQDLERG